MIVYGLHFLGGGKTGAVWAAEQVTHPWRTCVASCCRTFKHLYRQQTPSLYLLYCTTTIFLLHLGTPVHKVQNADNQFGLSFFEHKIVRFWFLEHQHWRVSPWAALWSQRRNISSTHAILSLALLSADVFLFVALQFDKCSNFVTATRTDEKCNTEWTGCTV